MGAKYSNNFHKFGGDCMKIQNSSVNLYGNSYDKERTSVKRTVQKNQLQQTMREQLRQLKQESKKNVLIEDKEGYMFEISEEDYQKITLLERLFSELLGREVKFSYAGKGKLNGNNYNGKVHQIINNAPSITYEEEIHFSKKSHMSMEASGTVQTEDGRTIEFNMNLSHTRNLEFKSYKKVTIGEVVDPLVLNFDGKLPKLSDKKFSFDLDHDGTSDQISYLTGESGFLSIDLNNDGKINDGSELFGPQSGSGFKDLRAYDGDGNGWIDENDDVFDKLRIWMKTDSGKDQLIALGEKGVGAIFLGAVGTSFELLDSELKTNGIISESGIYLREDGIAGNIHHVDLTI